MKQFDAVDVIRVKRDGGKLSTEEIQWTIDAYTRGVMKDEQMAALAMAVSSSLFLEMNSFSMEVAHWFRMAIARLFSKSSGFTSPIRIPITP